MNFGIFVCSRCSGLHRDLNHKVKGLGMCTFNSEEVAQLSKMGNEVPTTLTDTGSRQGVAKALQEVAISRAGPEGCDEAEGIHARCLRAEALPRAD